MIKRFISAVVSPTAGVLLLEPSPSSLTETFKLLYGRKQVKNEVGRPAITKLAALLRPFGSQWNLPLRLTPLKQPARQTRGSNDKVSSSVMMVKGIFPHSVSPQMWPLI